MQCVRFSICTLVYLINVQDVIIMQAGKFPKINKRAGCNKAMQVGIFQKSIVKKSSCLESFQILVNVQDVIKPCRLEFLKINSNKSSLLENFQKLINMQDVIRPCRLENFKKLIRTCCTFIR